MKIFPYIHLTSPVRRKNPANLPGLELRWPSVLLTASLLTACTPADDGTAPPAAIRPQPTAAPATAPAPPAPLVLRADAFTAALRGVVVEVTAAAFDGDRLVLEVGFENTGDSSYAVAGDLGAADFRVGDDSGSAAPVGFSDELRRLDDGGGLAPGARRSGAVVFPRPLGDAFVLRVPGFEPIELRADRIAALDAEAAPDQPASERRPAAEPAGAGVLAELDALLARQASALERYDLDAYLETFVPERRAEEAEIFRRLRPLPVVAVELALDRAAASPRQRGGGLEATVELAFRLDGLPADNPFHHPLRVLFERRDGDRDGGWLVASMAETGDRPILWRRGELAAQRSHHFLIYADPPIRSLLPELAADAEAAYAELQRRGLPLERGYLVVALADRAEFARLAGRVGALGVALARYRRDGDRFYVDSRAFYVDGTLFDDQSRRSLPPEARRVTVTHELVHLALAAESRPYTPVWLKEGAAVYFSGDRSFDADRRLVRAGMDHLSLERMTAADVLGEHDRVGRQAADEYLFAGNVVAYLVEQHGRDRFLAFYRGFAERPAGDLVADLHSRSLNDPALLLRVFENVPGAIAGDLTDELLREHYGLDVAGLEAAVEEWLWLRHR